MRTYLLHDIFFAHVILHVCMCSRIACAGPVGRGVGWGKVVVVGHWDSITVAMAPTKLPQTSVFDRLLD